MQAIKHKSHPTLPLFLFAAFIYAVALSNAVWAGERRWIRLGPESGSVSALALDPSNPQILYAAVTNEGLFKSTDGGTSWNMLARIGMSPTEEGYLTVDPASPQTIYSEKLKSTDGGQNWLQLEPDIGSAPFVSMAISPVDAKILYAGTRGRGLLKSTNGGKNWSEILASYDAWFANAVTIDPNDPHTVYAGTESKIFKSSDDGAHWSEASTGLPTGSVNDLAIDSISRRIYAATATGVYVRPTARQPGFRLVLS